MGGNIFKNKSRFGRMSTEELESFYKPKLIPLLNSISSQYSFLPYIKEKEDHGDIDVLVVVDLLDSNYKTKIEQTLIDQGIVEFNSEKNMLSFLFKDVQVDLIFTSIQSFNWKLLYYSHNDFGGLIGTILSPHNIKYSVNGLYYNQYYGMNSVKLKTHFLTDSLSDLFNLLQLSLDKPLNQGFNTYKEMFDYLYECPFFDSSLFVFENMTNKKRTRAIKRNTYQLAVKYYQTLPLKITNLLDPFLSFDFLEEDCEKVVKEYSIRKDYDSIINGFVLISLSNKFKENPKLIGDFKQKMLNKYFHFTYHTLTKDLLEKEVSEYLLNLSEDI